MVLLGEWPREQVDPFLCRQAIFRAANQRLEPRLHTIQPWLL